MGARITSSSAARRGSTRDAEMDVGHKADGEPAVPPVAPVPHVGEAAEPSPGRPRRYLTLKQMVNGAGTTARAVRFYEAQDLIRSMSRTRGGHRQFDCAELDKLRLVIDLRTCGFSIEEIREVLQARGRGATVRESAQAVQGLLAGHVRELQRKIAIIERLGREFHASVQVLERCALCTDPRGAEACHSCEVPRQAPPSFRQIWAGPPAAGRGAPGQGPAKARQGRDS